MSKVFAAILKALICILKLIALVVVIFMTNMALLPRTGDPDRSQLYTVIILAVTVGVWVFITSGRADEVENKGDS